MRAGRLTALTAASAAAGSLALGFLALAIAHVHGGVAPLWLANAVLLAPTLRFRWLPFAAILAGGAAGLVGANLAGGTSLPLALALPAANMAEIAIAYRLYGWFHDPDRPAYSTRNLAVFLGSAGVVATGVSAMIGAGALSIATGAAFTAAALRWFAADALGMIVVGPLLLAGLCGDCLALLRSRRAIEVVPVVAAAGAITWLVFRQATYPALFVILPVLTAAAFRLRFVGASVGIVAVALVASLETMGGHGPIASRLIDGGERILFLQAFLAVAVVATIPIAATLVERSRITRLLADSEHRFRRLAGAAPVAMIRTDERGHITYANDGWRAMVGVRAGGGWLDAIAPEGRDEAGQRWSAAATARTGFEADLPLLRTDDSAGWASLAMRPEIDEDGAILAWVATAADIEDRRRAEQRLAESEQQFRLLAEHSNDLIVRIGVDGRRRYVSPASRAILGYDPEELIGDTPLAAIHPEDRARVERVCRTLLDGADSPVCTYRQRCRDGSYAWLEATYRLVRDRDGAPVEFIATVRDVGRHRGAELGRQTAMARLEESHRLLRMAEGMAGVGHWRLDALTRALFWSDEVYRIHGRAPGDIPTLAEAILVYHPDDVAMVEAHVARALADGTPWTMRARIIRADGAVRHIESGGQAERAPDGTVMGLVGVFRDVTETVEAEAALIAARDEARASADAKSAFLATMSHEIRTPMTGVLGMIELLRTEPSPADRVRFFDNLEQSASLLMTVLDDVLDFSKIESGNLALESVDFDLAELARNTLDLFHHAASTKGLLLSLAVPVGRDTMVRGDPVRLQQVISNLVSNAIKFTAAGTVELRVDLTDESEHRVVRCTVTDSGIGIAADMVERLFEPFVQADASTTRRFGGTGLGLAISKRLVEAMDGSIAVESTAGSGTAFRFEARLAPGSAARDSMPFAPTPPSRPLSILLAEDNQINRALVETLVTRAGHRIRCVENGRLAVEAAGAERFDVIVMDMQMPEMDGLAATRAIRAGDGPCATAPIVALTADASAERRRFYDNAGLSDFLTKPIDSQLLLARLQAIAGDAPPTVPTIADATGSPIPLLDEVKLAGLEAAIGAANVARLLELLHEELAARPAVIARMIGLGQWADIVEEAHALKGAALNVGANRVGEIARLIEREAAGSHDLTVLMEDLTAAARATRGAMEKRERRSA